MLVEFRVKNFRSLRDEQVLSLVASKDKTLHDTHTKLTGIRAVPTLLPSAVIYGANASGKSNLIKALQFMRGVVTESATVIQPGQAFAVQPFRLDADSASQPSEFEVTFLLDGVRYQYGFSMTTQRIMSEYLLVYKLPKPQQWFKRHFDSKIGKDVYSFGHRLKGPKHLWEGATRPNALFLSMAVQLNSDSLRPIFDWFLDRLIIVNELMPINLEISTQILKKDGVTKICNLLSSADISITNIDIETRKVSGHTVNFDLLTGKTAVREEEKEMDFLRFHHATEQGKAVFSLMEESQGTRNLFGLAGPVLNTLEKGLTLVIDELDTSLHTLLLRELVGLFHQPTINSYGAQLIFITHDTALLDTRNLFRRDQIWFVEKDCDQSSSLISLSEFSPRKNEAFERGYLAGRYGGVPFLSHALGL